MKFDLLKRNIKTIGLSLLLAGGVFIGSNTTIKAQGAPPPDVNTPRVDARRDDAGGGVFQNARNRECATGS